MKNPICNCANCNNIGIVPIALNRRGGRRSYLCAFHAERLEGYSTENTVKTGTVKAHGFTYGLELETSHSTLKARAEILANGYIPTSDSTVDVEYKSPIYDGLNGLSKQCVSYERLMNDGELQINDSCGTHFHVGHKEWINADTIAWIGRFYHSLFTPISTIMAENPELTAALFGREFNYWAAPINGDSYAYDHTNWINLQHSYSLEFRLCKFRNAKQYMAAVKLCHAITACVINNFVVHFNDELSESQLNRYGSVRGYRKHKAKVTAEKLVKLYKKAVGI